MKKRRKGKMLQRMMASLLSALLAAGMVSGTAPVTVFAEENPEMQESVRENPAESAGGSGAEGAGTESAGGSGAEGTGTESAGGSGAEGAGTENAGGSGGEGAGTETTGGEAGSEDPEESGTEEKTGETEMPPAENVIEKEQDAETVSGNDVESEVSPAPQKMRQAEQADILASGEGWELDVDGKLTISSDAGMTDWIEKGKYANEKKVISIVIQGNVTGIGVCAFEGCSNLTSIEIPESVTDIGASAFNGCSALTGIEIPSGVTSIEAGVFVFCSKLKSVRIPSGVTDIGVLAFAFCDSLTGIELPDSVTGIGLMAFVDNNKLANITIPAGVTSIGYGAFSGCRELKSVTMKGSIPPELGENAFRNCYFYWNGEQGIHVPAAAADDYRRAWEAWEDSITGGLGTFFTGLDSGENVPVISIYTRNEDLRARYLTDTERGQLDQNADVTYCIGLEARDAGNTVSDSDREMIESALNGFTVGQYLDFKLYKEGTDVSRVYITEGELAIGMEVPEGLKNTDGKKTRTFAVIRVHNGQAAFLEDQDSDADSITIDADGFSIYAIVYQDTANGGGGGGDGGSENGSGGGDGSSENGNGGGDGGSENGSGGGDGGSENGSGGGDGGSENGSGGSSGDRIASSAGKEKGSHENNGGRNGNRVPGANGTDPAHMNEPRTGDDTPAKLYAALAMAAGFIYLLLFFAGRRRGMTEEK